MVIFNAKAVRVELNLPHNFLFVSSWLGNDTACMKELETMQLENDVQSSQK